MKTQNKLILLMTLTLSFAIANTVSADFFQGFETDNSGWNLASGQFTATQVGSGTHGITSHTGNFHAEAPGPYQLDTGYLPPGHEGGSAYTNYGGYSYAFVGGWITDVWIYLDTTATTVNDTRFDWITSSVSQPNCEFQRDFVFNGGFYNDSDPYGSGPRFVISAGNNSGRDSSDPKNPGHDPITIATSGWYKFEGQFNNNANVLSVIMRIFNLDGSLLHEWDPLSDPSDIIGSTVGGNRYGWFASQEFPFLAFDDSQLTGVQYLCGSQPAGSPGYWMTHPDAWCAEMQSFTIGTNTYTDTQAIVWMRGSTNKDMSMQMFAQFVAAKLNVTCNDSNQDCVADAMADAYAWLMIHPVGSHVAANSSAWRGISWAYNILADYNKGLLCAPPMP